jgi:chromosome segregation ATPase
MGQNCSLATSPVLQIEDYDDFKQWQQRRHGIGLRVRTLIVLVLSAWMSYVQYSTMKTRSDRVLAQYSALKAQYDQIEAKKSETLAQYAALKAQYDQIEAKKDALKAQYDRIEAMRNESLAQSCAWKAQHTGMNSKKSDNIPNSLKTQQ